LLSSATQAFMRWRHLPRSAFGSRAPALRLREPRASWRRQTCAFSRHAAAAGSPARRSRPARLHNVHPLLVRADLADAWCRGYLDIKIRGENRLFDDFNEGPFMALLARSESPARRVSTLLRPSTGTRLGSRKARRLPACEGHRRELPDRIEVPAPKREIRELPASRIVGLIGCDDRQDGSCFGHRPLPQSLRFRSYAGNRVAITLSIRRLSRSTTSNRQPSASTLSPVVGSRCRYDKRKPATVS
jgi:hypothetical protein